MYLSPIAYKVENLNRNQCLRKTEVYHSTSLMEQYRVKNSFVSFY